ncbi:AgmX/PglI C-terminal domain-containing protein [Marinobacter zhejiangensis]|uniref:Outer membrane transport energization protein TonB n=1 Tax=Marinobacter zhejiangensis TaxID=488535 RepID=A0A1I4RR41_9GAMM|nr:AgmX/PglI C-terminal domain-containing protein [Marinobacter zhejiangensis]SFM54678.1 hypothetical protein SAMN04487963_2901 [Marinobacter zhejiangensis]
MGDRYGSSLPWAAEKGDRARFGSIVVILSVLFVGPALWIPFVELPEPDRSEAEALPPQLARLMERKPLPEPEQEPMVADPEPEETVAEPEPPAPVEPEVRPAPAVADRPNVEPPQQTVQQAREVAARSGLLALQSQLAQMREPKVNAPQTMTANVVDASSVHADGLAEPGPEVLSGSGGVRSESVTHRDVELAGHQVRQVEDASPVEAEVARVPPPAGPAQRGMNNIRQVFDAQKTALYALYRRELRQDPTLEGKVLLELVIEPDGRVSRCEVISSELGNPTLESRLASRVLLFNFGTENVERRTVRFPIDFLPS